MKIAICKLPLEAVALDETFNVVPNMVVEVERLIAHDAAWTMPFIWVADVDFSEVDDAIADDSSVEKIIDSETFSGIKYYHVHWDDRVLNQMADYVEKGGSIWNAAATKNGWLLRMKFSTEAELTGFRDYLSNQDHSSKVRVRSEPEIPHLSFEGVTPHQRKSLIAALENGYYAIPRSITQEELANILDISHQNLSEILRRGTRRLISSTLTSGDIEAQLDE